MAEPSLAGQDIEGWLAAIDASAGATVLSVPTETIVREGKP